jgi:hypothetical protein
VPGGGIAGEIIDGEANLIGQRVIARTGADTPADGGETALTAAAKGRLKPDRRADRATRPRR